MNEANCRIYVTIRYHRIMSVGVLSVGLLLLVHTNVIAQTEPTSGHHVPVSIDSGLVENTVGEVTAVFSTTVRIPEAVWTRLDFGEVFLAGDIRRGTASYLRMASLADGADQVMNATHVAQWHNSSAYFNGDAVQIEIIAYPNTGPNRLVIREVTIGVAGEDRGERAICDGTDDREPLDDKRVGRGWTKDGGAECTAFLIDDCAHCLLTAGHCRSPPALEQVHFNVPLSDSDGNPVMSHPDDQYAVDPDSWQSGTNATGDDWAHVGCFRNPTTRLTPYEAQQQCFTIDMPPAPSGQEIRVTGCGITNPPISKRWNRALKSHKFQHYVLTDSTIYHRVDT
ncbi:MAG: hypothetical protein JSU63_05320, partial [Phycisphaerales bacterium]